MFKEQNDMLIWTQKRDDFVAKRERFDCKRR